MSRMDEQVAVIKELQALMNDYKAGNVSLEDAQKRAKELESEMEGIKTRGGFLSDIGATALDDGLDKVGDILTGKKASDAEEEAIGRAEVIAAETKEEQQQIIGETKEEIIASNQELLAYADEKNIEIEKLLLDATDETARILLQGLQDAKNSEEQGLTDAAGQILEGLNTAEQHLLSGETGAKDAAIAAIGEASARFEETKTESKELFAPWIENGQWASDELRTRSEELTRKFTLDDFHVDPGYEEEVKAGQKAILNYGSSIGITGNTAKDLVEFSQAKASQAVDKAFIRFRDFQNNATNYLTNVSNQGKSAATQYSQILENTNANLAQLDLEKGNTLAGYLRNTGIIKSDTERSRAGVRTDLTLGKSALDTRLIGDTAAVDAGRVSDTGTIKARTLAGGIGERRDIAVREQSLSAGLAGANVNVTGNYGATSGNLALALGDVRANQARNETALVNNTLKNYLFLKYSGVTGGGGGGDSGGGSFINPTANPTLA